MKTKLLIFLFLIIYNKSIAQIAYKAQKIDSLIETVFNSQLYEIAKDSITLLLEGRQAPLYFFYRRDNNDLKAMQEDDRVLKLRTTFYYDSSKLIKVDVKQRKDSASTSYYFIGEETFLKGIKKYKKISGSYFKSLSNNYVNFFSPKKETESN